MKHKLLSILLCLAMALSLLPTAALAEETVTYPAEVQNERELRYALYSAPENGTRVTIKLTSDITLEMLYAAENFGTEKLDDNAAGDTFNRYKRGVHPTAEDPDHWNPLVIDQTPEQRVAYGAYYHMSATDERIARLVVKAGQNIVLDLNGHTIQKNARATHGDWSNTCTDIIGNYGTLTITDTSTGEKGTIKGIGYISCEGAVLHNYTNATLTVGAVNVDGNAAGMAAGTGQYVIANDGGTIIIDGTNVYDTATSASLLVNKAGTMTVQNNAVLNHPNTKTINAKGGNVTIENATISSDRYAIFATKNSIVTINSGVTINGTGTVIKDENTATVNNNTGAGLPVPVGYEWVEENGMQTLKMNAAVVGGVNYPTLEAALAALNGTNHTLTLIDGSAWTYKDVYWSAGSQVGSEDTLKAAMEAAYAENEESITIICKPNATITKSNAHIDVTGDITVYANGADFGGNDLSIGTSKDPKTSETTINIYDARNLVVWGQPVGDRDDVWNVNFTDCVNDGWNFLMYRGDETGIAKINATLTGCTATGFEDSIIHTTADGSITIKNCKFANNCAPVNIAHKQAGKMTVTVENSTFTNCGSTNKTNNLNQYAAPVRIVNNNAAGTVATEVTNCTFAGTVGNNGDILIGDGRDGKDSNDVTLTVKNTEAEVQAQKPGYYGADGAVSDTSLVRKTSVVNSATPVTITLDSEAFDLAQVGDTGYSNLTDAISAAQSGGKTVTLLTADDVLLQAILDGQYGSIDGLTIELPTGSYGQLELGRATKYAGSKTEYYVGGFDESSDKYQKFDSAEALKTYKNGEGWTPLCYYVRNMNDVTLKAAAGADVEIAGMTATAGHIYGTSGAPVTDYVLDTTTESTGDSYYLAQNWSNITFEGLTFTAKVDIASSLEKTVIDGVSFENCNFNINNTASGNQALRYYNELDNEQVSGLTVDNCTFTNCFQGVYTQKIKNITVTNSTFDTTAHNAIAIQSGDNAANHGDVVITNNTFTNIGDRIIRFNNVAEGTNITITDNTATNSGDETGEVIKATSVAEGVTTTIYSNNWGPNTTVGNGEFQDTAAPSSGGSSSSSGDYSISVDADKHGTVTVSPKRADKGDTVTITVKPNKGYELDELTVTDANGNEISVRSRGNNQYTFTMPRSRVTIEATFAEIEEEPDLFFVDVPTSAYYYDAVYWAAENGVTYGTSATTFSPDVIVSRAQMVTFLWRAHGSPAPRSSVNPFTDVSSSAYYYGAVLWAVENGVTNGTSATTFSPDATVTRAQAVTFQWRAAGSPAVSGGSFADVADSAYYAGAVSWAVANGVTNGTGGSNFSPDVGVSRAQAVTFLWRQLA